jgi:signal transduction histidine kinase
LTTIDREVVREHATRILTSVEEANRVIDELLRFSEDRVLNLCPHHLDVLLAECVAECAPRATRAASSWRGPWRPTSSSRSTSTR